MVEFSRKHKTTVANQIHQIGLQGGRSVSIIERALRNDMQNTTATIINT